MSYSSAKASNADLFVDVGVLGFSQFQELHNWEKLWVKTRYCDKKWVRKESHSLGVHLATVWTRSRVLPSGSSVGMADFNMWPHMERLVDLTQVGEEVLGDYKTRSGSGTQGRIQDFVQRGPAYIISAGGWVGVSAGGQQDQVRVGDGCGEGQGQAVGLRISIVITMVVVRLYGWKSTRFQPKVLKIREFLCI